LYNVTFHAGEISVTLNISITDDNTLENDEDFVATIDPTLNIFIVNNGGTATVTIIDNDGK